MSTRSVVSEAFAGLEKRMAKLNLGEATKMEQDSIFNDLGDLPGSQPRSELDWLMDDLPASHPMIPGLPGPSQPELYDELGKAADDPTYPPPPVYNNEFPNEDVDKMKPAPKKRPAPAAPPRERPAPPARRPYDSVLPSAPRRDLESILYANEKLPEEEDLGPPSPPRKTVSDLESILRADEQLPEEENGDIPNLTLTLSPTLVQQLKDRNPTTHSGGPHYDITPDDLDKLKTALKDHPPKPSAIWYKSGPAIYNVLLKHFHLVCEYETTAIPDRLVAAILRALEPLLLREEDKKSWRPDNLKHWYYRNRGFILQKYVLYDHKTSKQTLREYYDKQDGKFPQKTSEWTALKRKTSMRENREVQELYKQVQEEALAEKAAFDY